MSFRAASAGSKSGMGFIGSPPRNIPTLLPLRCGFYGEAARQVLDLAIL